VILSCLIRVDRIREEGVLNTKRREDGRPRGPGASVATMNDIDRASAPHPRARRFFSGSQPPAFSPHAAKPGKQAALPTHLPSRSCVNPLRGMGFSRRGH
jgi:hypothetical protein